MTILSRVRQNFSNAYAESRQNQQKASAGFEGAPDTHVKTRGAPSVGFAGTLNRHLNNSAESIDAPRLEDVQSFLETYRVALVMGRLILCANCRSFVQPVEPYGLGHCQHYNTSTWGAVPSPCDRFSLSEHPAFPLLQPDPEGALNQAREYAR